MLLDKFYTLQSATTQDGAVKAAISFHRNHPIFEGHFPGHPVVPGVCMIQIVREIMEKETVSRLKIATGENIKFLAVINPDQNKEVDVAINFTPSEKGFTVNASIQSGAVTFFKFKGSLERI
ncbi:MAG TPA: hypothetical protein VKZ68_03290 [Ohtaekwangia sp.]|nr:hypothetical protein [Ohtaekwangia sp.]